MNDSDCLDHIRSTVSGIRPLSNDELTKLVGDLINPVETSCRLRGLHKELYRLADTVGMEGFPDSNADLVKAIEKRMTQLSARVFTSDDGSYAEIVSYAGEATPEGLLGSMTIRLVRADKTVHRITLKREEFHGAAAATPAPAPAAPIQFNPHPRLFRSPPPVAPTELLRRLYEWEALSYEASGAILRYARTKEIHIVQACLDAGVSPEAVLSAVANLMHLPLLAGRCAEDAPAAVCKLPAPTAHEYGIVPLRIEGNALVVATCDPANIDALDDLRFMLAIPQLRVELCSEAAFQAAFRTLYSTPVVKALLA